MEKSEQNIEELRKQQEASIQTQYLTQANESCIDFKSQMRREKNLAEAKVDLKMVSPMNAFNLLQDLRHLIILDFRKDEAFDQSHIRKALRVSLSDYKEKIAGCIVSLHEKTRPGKTLSEHQK